MKLGEIEDRPRMIRKFEVNIGEGIILAFSYDYWDEYRGHIQSGPRKSSPPSILHVSLLLY